MSYRTLLEQSLSDKLTNFALNLKFEDIPAEALKNAKYHVLDTIGVCLAASRTDTAQSVKNVISRLGTNPECSIFGSIEKVTAPQAAMANCTMAHTPDFDDTHGGSVIHISSVVVPASLAISEYVKSSGKDYITAVVAGYEVTNRLGMVAPGKYHANGFNPTALLGNFGVIMMTGKLKGLSQDVTRNALGIAGSQAAGLIEHLSNGSSVKQIHPGWAAYSGIISTMLAEEGITGPDTVFEGKFGIFNTHLGKGQFVPEKAVANLGEVWEVNDIAYKSYPCCHHAQAFLDCVKEIKSNYDLRLEDIEDIEAIIAPKQAEIICEPLEEKYIPKTPYDAKFSLPYQVSVMLHRGKVGLSDFTEESIKEENVLRLARKFRFTTSDNTGYPGNFPGWVKIKLKDGRILEHKMKTNRGSQGNPLSDEEIIAKFEDNASLVLPSDQVKRIKELLLNIETVDDISELTGYLRF